MVKAKLTLVSNNPKPKQPHQTELEKKTHKQRHIVTADAWDSVLNKYYQATPKRRAQLDREVSYEISIQDIRDQVIAIVHERFGRDSELAFEEVRARNGASPSTLRKWANGTTLRPQLNKLRQVLRACGKDFQIGDL